MAKKTFNNDGLRVLVCGSQRCIDKGFVFSLLNGFAAGFDISAVLSGPFSGADEIAREWAKERGIAYEPVHIADSDRMQLTYFDESRALPEGVLKHDSMYRNGFARLRDSGASVVLIIPNPEGVLGPTSACLMRMSAVIEIPCIDCSGAILHLASKLGAAANALEPASRIRAPLQHGPKAF